MIIKLVEAEKIKSIEELILLKLKLADKNYFDDEDVTRLKKNIPENILIKVFTSLQEKGLVNITETGAVK